MPPLCQSTVAVPAVEAHPPEALVEPPARHPHLVGQPDGVTQVARRAGRAGRRGTAAGRRGSTRGRRHRRGRRSARSWGTACRAGGDRAAPSAGASWSRRVRAARRSGPGPGRRSRRPPRSRARLRAGPHRGWSRPGGTCGRSRVVASEATSRSWSRSAYGSGWRVSARLHRLARDPGQARGVGGAAARAWRSPTAAPARSGTSWSTRWSRRSEPSTTYVASSRLVKTLVTDPIWNRPSGSPAHMTGSPATTPPAAARGCRSSPSTTGRAHLRRRASPGCRTSRPAR